MDIKQLSPAFSATAQLNPAQMLDCKQRGFAVILNNRPDGEVPNQPSSSELAEAAKSSGLGYAYLPIEPGKMTDCDARELGDIVAAADGPVLAFCRSGARSTQLWQRAGELGMLRD